MLEVIPDSDTISRLLFEPFMRAEDKDVLWENVFQFSSKHGAIESVVWRKYAPTLAAVHALGCQKQTSDRAAGKRSAYFGSLTGDVAEIRTIRSANGICFTIDHAPAEGIWHAHVGFSDGSNKNDRNSMKVMLRAKFGDVETHICPDQATA